MRKFRIGHHIDASTDFINIPEFAKQIGCEIFQIFLGDPQQTRNKSKSHKILTEFGKQLAINKLKMVVHGSYTINLCHPIESARHIASVNAVIKDLKMVTIIGKRCVGVIIHMGKNIKDNGITDNVAAQNYIVGLKTVLSQTDNATTLILETGAGQGNEIGTNLSVLATIYWALEEHERKRIKFCIDTCHIWAAGYDIGSKMKVNVFFEMFEKLFERDKIACFHFNDSKTALDSHKDRHADIGYGLIPTRGLKSIAQYAHTNRIPLVLETPLDSVNLKTNRNITFSDEVATIYSYLN